MTGDRIDDELLMAYADGELDGPEAARIEAALRDDPAIAERLSLFTGTRKALREAATIRRAEPMPEHVLARARAAIEAGQGEVDPNVVPLRRPERRTLFRPAAIAAAIALAGFLGGYLLSPDAADGPEGALRVSILDMPGLAEALERVPAGDRVDLGSGEIAVVASFRDADGTLCREFELDTADAMTVVSVACRMEQGWDPRLAIVAEADDGTQYAPASSLETLDAYLGAIGAGPPLSPEEEAAALEALD